MKEYRLNIGEVVTSSRNVIYTCFGLGSCIGLFIHDRLTGISGGAHIFLPETEDDFCHFSSHSSAPKAIDELLRQLKMSGSSLECLRAKVTGGANVFGFAISTGEQNAEAALRYLIRRKIYIAAKDLGGPFSRTAKYDSSSGKLTVQLHQINQQKIY